MLKRMILAGVLIVAAADLQGMRLRFELNATEHCPSGPDGLRCERQQLPFVRRWHAELPGRHDEEILGILF